MTPFLGACFLRPVFAPGRLPQTNLYSPGTGSADGVVVFW
jgi:hypothetical protein